MNKKLNLVVFGIIILLVSTACLAVTGKSDSNSNSGKEGNQSATVSSDLPKQQNESTNPGSTFNSFSGKMPKAGGIITEVTLALSTQGSNYDPIDPTIKFGPGATIHSVVTIVDAPEGTNFSAKWLTTDVGDADKPNKLIDETAVTTGGSRNIDFSLAPVTKLPVGNYRVEITVNNKLDQIKEFSIISGGPEGNSTSDSSIPAYIESVTMAKGVKGATKDPVNPTSVFGQKDIIHAVTKLIDAPDGTNFTAKWLVTDIGDVAKPDTLIDSLTLTAGGNKNIDFTLEPTKPLPKGTYRVEILVNDQTTWVEPFEVK